MLLGTFGTSLLGNNLAGKGLIAKSDSKETNRREKVEEWIELGKEL